MTLVDRVLLDFIGERPAGHWGGDVRVIGSSRSCGGLLFVYLALS